MEKKTHSISNSKDDGGKFQNAIVNGGEEPTILNQLKGEDNR